MFRLAHAVQNRDSLTRVLWLNAFRPNSTIPERGRHGSRHSRIFDRLRSAKLWDITGSGFLGDESDAASLVPIRT
jgi:hypothetical protein